jgi:hypothetical protein
MSVKLEIKILSIRQPYTLFGCLIPTQLALESRTRGLFLRRIDVDGTLTDKRVDRPAGFTLSSQYVLTQRCGVRRKGDVTLTCGGRNGAPSLRSSSRFARAMEEVHCRPEQVLEIGFDAGVRQCREEGVEDVGEGAANGVRGDADPVRPRCG